MSWYLGFNSLDEITEEQIKKRYDFMMIFENYDKSIAALSAKLGFDFKVLHVRPPGPPAGRAGNHLKKGDVVSKETEQLFKENNQQRYCY